MRRSKIVCTLGPATSSEEKIRELIAAGMDVVRINCSHGTLDEHGERIATVRRVAQEFDKPVAILVDLQGPKIRLAQFANGSEILEVGQSFTITTREVTGDATIVGTTFKGLPGDCQVGDTLLVDDGNIKLRVTQVSETDVTTEVVVGGRVSDHKGLNLPGAAVSVPALSEKDQQDLRWAMTQPIDYVALSFVRTATDVQDVYNLMDECGGRLPVLAKIEKPQAVDNLVDIIENCDGIMVARGDLGVEMALEMVPVVQKRVIQECRFRGKPVIVATQVLESMITHARPTRAEASDCANAIWDGADAVMMSGETAVGQYPIEAVQTMSDIIEAAEERGYAPRGRHRPVSHHHRGGDVDCRSHGCQSGGVFHRFRYDGATPQPRSHSPSALCFQLLGRDSAASGSDLGDSRLSGRAGSLSGCDDSARRKEAPGA